MQSQNGHQFYEPQSPVACLCLPPSYVEISHKTTIAMVMRLPKDLMFFCQLSMRDYYFIITCFKPGTGTKQDKKI